MVIPVSKTLKYSSPNFMPGLSYIVVAAVAAGEIIDQTSGMPLVPTLGLLVLFLLLHRAARRTDRTLGFVAATVAEAAGAIAVMVIGSSPSYGVVLFFVLCPLVAWRMPLRFAISAAALATVVATVLLVLAGQGFQSWFPTFIGWALGFSALIGFSVMYQRSRQEQAESEQLLAELTEAQDRVREMAILKERDRLAREMHDAVGHRLTVVSVLLESAGRFIPSEPQRAVEIVATSRAQVREGLEELRAAVRALVTPEQRTQTITQMLTEIVAVFSQAAVAKVTLTVQPGLTEPDTDRKLVIVRTAQEALTNAQKHSLATSVDLVLGKEGGAYLLTCSDNGRGIPAEAAPDATGRHFGLENLRTRAAALGGSIELSPSSGGGTLLRLSLPVGVEVDHG